MSSTRRNGDGMILAADASAAKSRFRLPEFFDARNTASASSAGNYLAFPSVPRGGLSSVIAMPTK